MRELLQQALRVIETDVSTVNPIQYTADVKSVTAALREALSRSKWVKVSDGLPVVPEGKFSVRIWVFRADKGKMFRANWWQHYGFQKINFTHWQYRQDDTPAPPEEV